MKLVILTLCRDEGSRWLPSLLSQWTEYADEIIALDDGSVDDTAALLRSAGAVVLGRGEYADNSALPAAAWGNEAPARAELFGIGVHSDADWLLWLDADMGFTRSPRALIEACDATGVDAIAFRLYDLWQADRGDLLYREDAYWRAHTLPRVWCIRRSVAAAAGEGWNDRGIHCGHLPPTLQLQRIVTAPRDISLLHFAYSRKDERMSKYAAYMRQAAQLTPGELAHAETIIDEEPRLLPLTPQPQWHVEYGRPYSGR